MTPEEARAIAEDVIREMLGVDTGERVVSVQYQGNISYKMLGEGIGHALKRSRFVLVDGSKVRSIAGSKVFWR